MMEECGKSGPLHAVDGPAVRDTLWSFLEELKIEQPFDAAKPPLGRGEGSQRERESCCRKEVAVLSLQPGQGIGVRVQPQTNG